MPEGYITEQSITIESGIRLDSGRILAPITLAYETYGTLNKLKTNAILVGHARTISQPAGSPRACCGNP